MLVHVYGFAGVWHRRTMIGWLSLGQQATAPSQSEHWTEMINSMGISIQKWHFLVTGDEK